MLLCRQRYLFYDTNHIINAGLDDFGIITNKELQFRPGITSLLVSIPIVNDDIVEGIETFSAVLKSTAAGVALAPNESSVIIFDDGK